MIVMRNINFTMCSLWSSSRYLSARTTFRYRSSIHACGCQIASWKIMNCPRWSQWQITICIFPARSVAQIIWTTRSAWVCWEESR